MSKQHEEHNGKMFTLRALVILSVSLALGAVVGLLTFLSTEDHIVATLALMGTVGVAVERLNDWVI